MPNLYTTIAHYDKLIRGVNVNFMRIKNQFGYCFVHKGKLYGNFISSRVLAKNTIDGLMLLLEGKAEEAIKKL